MHDQLISPLVLRRQRQIYRIIVVRVRGPENLRVLSRDRKAECTRIYLVCASVIGGRYDADEIAAIIGAHGYRSAASRIAQSCVRIYYGLAECFFRN